MGELNISAKGISLTFEWKTRSHKKSGKFHHEAQIVILRDLNPQL